MLHTLTAILLLTALPAMAQDTIIVAPVYSQLVAFPAPAGFQARNEAEKAGSYLLELLPQGETLGAWSQMLTLTGARGGAAGQTVLNAATTIGEGYRAACPDTFSARSFPAPKIKGAVQAFGGYLGCGTVDGHSEEMVFVIVQGKADLFTVQWAARGPAKASPIVVDAAIWKPRADALALTRICDKVPGEAAPYPSCTQ